jgi:hypothetical protein
VRVAAAHLAGGFFEHYDAFGPVLFGGDRGSQGGVGGADDDDIIMGHECLSEPGIRLHCATGTQDARPCDFPGSGPRRGFVRRCRGEYKGGGGEELAGHAVGVEGPLAGAAVDADMTEKGVAVAEVEADAA